VDGVAGGAGDAAHDCTHGFPRRWTRGDELERIEESRDQAELWVGSPIVIRIQREQIRPKTVNRLGQHRVAEAINGVRKLGDNRRINGGIIAEWRQKLVDVGIDGARKFLEDEMLVLHFCAEAAGLK